MPDIEFKFYKNCIDVINRMSEQYMLYSDNILYIDNLNSVFNETYRMFLSETCNICKYYYQQLKTEFEKLRKAYNIRLDEDIESIVLLQ